MIKRYVTLCNNEKYIKGTLTLYESLNATNTKIPLVVFCSKKTPEHIRAALKKYAEMSSENVCKLEIFESSDDVNLPEQVAANNKWLRWNGTFDKLLIFGLAQYDKLVFLDSDMIVLKNLDHLFEKPHMSACTDGQYDKYNLNSGIMVIEPTEDKAEMDRILSYLSAVVENLQFGDQDIIRLAFPEWSRNQTLHLPEEYNLFYENAARRNGEFGLDIANTNKSPIYVVHFIGYDKPWYEGKQFKWKVYNFVWKFKLCLDGYKRYKNCICVKILRIYRKYLKLVGRRLQRIKIKIYEMN